MPKLVLINPASRHFRIAKQGFKIPPLHLAYLAAFTDDTWDVTIQDENFEPATVVLDADLVGITTLTSTVNRAYELAQQYRDRSIPVVLGGIHASMVPEEAEQHADAVVIGEAESVWQDVLRDTRKGELKSRYQGERPTFTRMKPPRRDLLSPAYTVGSIQTSRGCPLDCEFCSVKAFNGSKFRLRDVDDVLDELATIPQNLIFFTDDNLIGYSPSSRERAKAIFRGMIERRMNKTWFGQTSITFADDDETLRLAAQSGCVMMLVGIESVDVGVLSGKMNKQVNMKRGPDYYDSFIRKLHDHKIIVIGTLVFANDEEPEDIFEQTTAFCQRSGVDIPWPGLLTPYPGTRLFERMSREGRIVYTDYPNDWEKYNTTLVVAPPTGDRAEFCRRFQDFTRINYSTAKIWHRTLRTFAYSRSLKRSALVYSFNRSLADRFRTGVLPDAPDGAERR